MQSPAEGSGDGWGADELLTDELLTPLESAGGAGGETGGSSSEVEVLQREIRSLQARLAESEAARQRENEELEGRLREVTQKAKDTMRQLQDKTQQLLRQKDAQILDLETELAAARCAEAEAKAQAAHVRVGADPAKESEELRRELNALEGELAEVQEEAKERAEVTSGIASEDKDLEVSGASDDETLKAKATRLEQLLKEAQADAQKVKEDSEAKIGEVVRKAKDHLKQVQTRLEATSAENSDWQQRYQDLNEANRQLQEKMAKYKQLMAQANQRIEESEAQVQELQESLSKSQSSRLNLQEMMGSIEKSHSIPPKRDEIALRGGILLAVESDNGDVWCLVNAGPETAEEAKAAEGAGTPEAARRARWWLLSQLDVEERPVPIQRRWKGEVSALRAQMLRFKQKSEEQQQEFESYRSKANAALQSTATHSTEITILERRAERLAEQLQAMGSELQAAIADKAQSVEELKDARRKLAEAHARRAELERAVERKAREAEETCAIAVESCRGSMDVQMEELQRTARDTERALRQELDVLGAQKEALGEEVESLRTLLASRTAAAAEAMAATVAAKAAAEAAAKAASEAAAEASARIRAKEAEVEKQLSIATNGAGTDARAGSHGQEGLLSQTEAQAVESLVAQAFAPDQPATPSGRHADDSDPFGIGSQAVQTLQTHQDLASLRSQVRQLEHRLQEEHLLYMAAKRDMEQASKELRELTSQQQLHNTVNQFQQMEYIRNVFRKFVEALPSSSSENEQLIPVLMTFFKFPDEEARAIQTRRAHSKPPASSQSLWRNLFPG